jgi:Icc-related predicted phosphoesterase
MKVVFFSDTHGLHDGLVIPDGDVLVFCGDLMNSGKSIYELESFLGFLATLQHKTKIVIAGNHDFYLEGREDFFKEVFLEQANAILLFQESITIDNVKFYGDPHQPEFCNWAYNVRRGPALKEIWSKIPEDVDVLITHGPPLGILDQILEGERVGCMDLLNRVKEIKPKIMSFGHIHEGYGTENKDDTLFINCSVCTRFYKPTNKPIVVEIDGDKNVRILEE